MLEFIPDPPPHTCPDIDKIIRAIQCSMNICKRAEKEYRGDPCVSEFDEIEYELYGLEDQLEKVRKANEELRSWGENWKFEAEKLAELFE